MLPSLLPAGTAGSHRLSCATAGAAGAVGLGLSAPADLLSLLPALWAAISFLCHMYWSHWPSITADLCSQGGFKETPRPSASHKFHCFHTLLCCGAEQPSTLLLSQRNSLLSPNAVCTSSGRDPLLIPTSPLLCLCPAGLCGRARAGPAAPMQVLLFLHGLKVLCPVCWPQAALPVYWRGTAKNFCVGSGGEPQGRAQSTAWAVGLAAGWSNWAALWGCVSQSSHCGQHLWWVQKWRSTGLPIMWHPGQVTEFCPVPSVWQQVPFCPSPRAEPSGPTPCTAAATCAGSPAGSRQATRSQALPAVLGPPTWKESCCSPPLPRNLSAKVRGAHAVYPCPLGTQQSNAL